jgi:HEAT repeat protein
MQTLRNKHYRARFAATVVLVLVASSLAQVVAAAMKQDQPATASLNQLQLRIEKQRVRLSSAEQEERRDAVSQLTAMHHIDASRVALAALKDPSASVRATAASSILALPVEECVASLIPLLTDKDEFVRREAAYALGKTRGVNAVAPLIDRLLTDKEDGVRGAAAVALGEISDPAAVSALGAVISFRAEVAGSKKNQKSKREKNPFVLRAAARSLGQIGSSNGAPALIGVLQDEKAEDDVRREAARALGLIGDPGSISALRTVLTARDPYLSNAAQEAIQKIQKPKLNKGT